MKTQNIMAYSYENGIFMKTVSEFRVFLPEFILCQTKSFYAAPHCFINLFHLQQRQQS